MSTSLTLERVRALGAQLAAEHTATPAMFRELANIETLLSETYRDRVAYELLQNSDDAGSTTIDIQVDNGVVRWSNDGRQLSIEDVTSLCRSATSTKTRGEAIGYRGIGFKSVASIARTVTVMSTGVAFTFDRREAAREIEASDPAAVPLIRLPTQVRECRTDIGVTFVLELNPEASFLAPDPLALLFLRNVERMTFLPGEARRVSFEISRNTPGLRRLNIDGESAEFAVLEGAAATVAVPLGKQAIALVGNRGRLAAFLPLDDTVGLPLVISGDITTDPSRKHAVLGDEATHAVLEDAAILVADALRDPNHQHFENLWEVIVAAPDFRAEIVAHKPTAASIFLTAVRRLLAAEPPPFGVVPVQLEAQDVARVFPAGAPTALYRSENMPAVKLVATAFTLRQIEVEYLSQEPLDELLSPETRYRVAQYLVDRAQQTRLELTDRVREYVERAGLVPPDVERSARPSTERVRSRSLSSFGEMLARWRVAEKVVAQWLNERGWNVEDVSTQNLGYDLSGVDATGSRVHVEVKKVDSPASRFALTTNEMATMQSTSTTYLIAVVAANAQTSQLMLLDPNGGDIPYEKVARQWQFEFYDWARHGEWLS